MFDFFCLNIKFKKIKPRDIKFENRKNNCVNIKVIKKANFIFNAV